MGVDEKALGQRLQQARQKAGLTQQELCQKAGLSYSTLAKIERGAIKSPSVFTVAAISAATATPMEALLDIAPAAAGGKKTSKTGVQFVYFDLNGTLVGSYERAFGKIAEQAGLPVDSVEALYWRYDDEVCSGQMSLDDFNAAMGGQLDLPDFNWPDYYLESTQPIEGMAELVAWTAEHYQVGLLSGTMPTLIDGLGKQGKIPLDKFSVIIDSSVVKLLKYSADIFEYAQGKAGVEAQNILLVDDEKLSIINADRLGWQICRFTTYDPAAGIAKIKSHLAF